ncbi:MAG: glycosyltransferase [Actinomycetota bacterium]|nr:glycosyltransferase [Actinomycetota bacterium]
MVVTRDRRDLLEECLRAVLAQTQPPARVVVVDNVSSDGTPEMVRERFPGVDLVVLDRNDGAAGGFHEGISAGMHRGGDWLWLMDDDTIPAPDALEQLLRPLDDLDGLPEPSLLASKVVWTDGTLHPKNLPWARLDESSIETFVSAADRRLVLLRVASWVSILVSRRAVEEHGLPLKHYFIWGEDGEWTARLLKHATGYMVPASVVHHKTPRKVSVHREGSDQYYFEVRNKLYQLRGDSWFGREKIHLSLSMIMGAGQYLVRERFRPRALTLLLRAVLDGLRRPGP